MKNILSAIILLGTLQGCAAVPLVGLAAGVGGVALSKDSAANNTEWAGKMSVMNCTQLRNELVRLEKKKNLLTTLNPVSLTGSQIASVKSTMHMRRCKLPA